MAMPDHEDLKKLKSFIDIVVANPTILNMPQLNFVKNFIEHFGGTIPKGDFQMPSEGKCPFDNDAGAGDREKSPEVDEEFDSIAGSSESDSEVEIDMDGVIDGDSCDSQPMGDPEKDPTEDEIEEASTLRGSAASAYSEQKYEEAIQLYTQAIELNPGNALFHAKRGQAFLKLQKPNACIRDCGKALDLNSDCAAAYKFRGRAHRLLGNWESAAKDLRQACKLDFDEEADDWLREVTPNAKKIEQHRIKHERKALERELKEKERRLAREKQQAAARAAAAAAAAAAAGSAGGAGASAGPTGGNPFGGNFGGLNFNDMLSGLKDPEIAAALKDIAENPANVDKYKSNPKLAKLIDLYKNMRGTTPGSFNPASFAGAFSGGASFTNPGAGTESAAGAGATPPPTTASPAPEQNKPNNTDYVDDGLD